MGMYEYIRKLYELHRLLGTLLSNELTASNQKYKKVNKR